MPKTKFVRVKKKGGGWYLRSKPGKKKTDGKKEIICRACKGTGQIKIPPSLYQTTHKACKGSGLLIIPKNARTTVCQGCRGTGLKKIPPSIFASYHDACGGTGLIIIE